MAREEVKSGTPEQKREYAGERYQLSCMENAKRETGNSPAGACEYLSGGARSSVQLRYLRGAVM